MSEQKEPDYCAQARVIDAAAWIEKAEAQLSVLSSTPEIRTVMSWLNGAKRMLLINYEILGYDGGIVGDTAHKLMVSHALLCAASHARYVNSSLFEPLMEQYRQSKL
jgi:hypothetical protein